jgi:NADH-quinone oxidoreductase subunit J
LPGVETLSAQYGQPVVVAETLFRQYLLPFEVTSILLLVGMIGAIVLTKNREGSEPGDQR